VVPCLRHDGRAAVAAYVGTPAAPKDSWNSWGVEKPDDTQDKGIQFTRRRSTAERASVSVVSGMSVSVSHSYGNGVELDLCIG